MIKFTDELRHKLFAGAKSRQEKLPKTLGELFSALDDLDETRACCLAFLLAELPETDLLNYQIQYFLQHIEESLRSYDFAPWKEKISQEMFLVYILMPRVNTEPLVLHRDHFRKELTERVENLSLEEAVIECNYYCYSKGTYQSTDGRTVSPMVFVDRAGGRCGEESVFVVSVLRSLGIPARQMYSPYWAHTDDNHAWVEAWTGDEWAYFGACEPEAVLNCGWFDGSARRAKIILSRTFSELRVPGDDYLEGAVPSGLVNQSKAYFEPVTFKLSLKNGDDPLKNTLVNLEILNYASDSPILALKTDSEGGLKVDIAEGSLLIHFAFAGLIFERWINLKEDCHLVIDVREEVEKILNSEYLSKKGDHIIDMLLDEESEIESALKSEVQFALLKNSEDKRGLFVAPTIKDVKQGEISQEKLNRHKEKYYAAKAVLDATNDSFHKLEEKAEEDDIDMGLVRNKARRDRSLDNVLHWARLNQKNVERILSTDSRGKKGEDYSLEQKLKLFTVLSNKDIADINQTVFYDHMTAFDSKEECINREKVEEEVWQKYVLSPRFERENLSAWREYFNRVLSDEQKEEWRKNPILIDAWVKENIATPDTSDYGGIYVSPENCYRHLRGNVWSKRILTLAIARSIGVAAYSESMSLRPMFIKKGQAKPFRREDILIEGNPKDKAKLNLIKANENEQFAYSSQFTIKQLADGSWRHVNPEKMELIENETSQALMDPGIYALNIVRRLQNGDQLYKRYFFILEKGIETSLTLALPEEEQELGKINLANFDLERDRSLTQEEARGEIADGSDMEKKALRENSVSSQVSSSDLFKRGKRIFIFLEAQGEPYSHLINDLSRSIDELADHADKFVFALSGKEDLKEPRLAKFLNELPQIEYYFMKEDLPKYLYNKYCCSLRELPLLTMFSEDGKLIFSSTGYRINTDQELLQRLRG